ncbi:ATP-binding protein [Methanorbis furvi]|uniref:AAA+ ATPase domain-containing protein n=1 Tax=Methanorbis furvi TaxID=3028299 RepID=A0AAE4S8Y8_9EURY|nr:hypothetical protein [Methanocorpusculaceae archaeon Ag1]
MQHSLLLHRLVLFRGLLDLPVYQKLSLLLADDGTDTVRFIDHYTDFVAELYSHTDNISEYIKKTVYESDNLYLRQIVENKPASPHITSALNEELKILEELSRITPQDLPSPCPESLPQWNTTTIDLVSGYADRMANIHRTGYGIFAAHHMFLVKDNQILPLRYPDPQTLDDLYGYEAEKNKVIANTLALLNGKPAVNVLLYGDAGTGKSSTVKAIVNEYASLGLRLIEIKKSQFETIPTLIEELASNPLKFILFIDDLSFAEGDGDFAALKAILEGSAAARTKNIVIYATSNRRHLVRVTFRGREGDDIHLNETLEETISLSARFGLVITFQKPDRDAYLEIVSSLAEEHGLTIPQETLFKGAEMHALRSSGRTPRAAKHYIELLAANTTK